MTDNPSLTVTSYTFIKKLVLLAVGCVIVSACFVVIAYTVNEPPTDFPIDQDIVIPQGARSADAIKILFEKKLIRSQLFAKIVFKYSFPNQYILAGIYRFPTHMDTYTVAHALVTGTFKSPALKLVLPEGFTTSDFYSYLPHEYVYDEKISLDTYEGMLFPDTYFISKDMKLTDILTLLTKTMDIKLASYTDKISKSGLSKNEVLVLASILEREANSPDSMKHVSGILQNRLKIGMPLQVDATLDYILHKKSSELSLDDLKIDNVMNTYLHAGLPPKPISNPGIIAIEAVLSPLQTKDLYYLTDAKGMFHYAETFEQHKSNKELYLH